MDIFILLKQTTMLEKLTYILLLGLTASLFSCSEATDETLPVDTEEVSTDTEVEEEPDQDQSESTETTEESDEISSRYNYDQDWEIFKTAVINEDIKGVSAFASSDEIDAEMLVEAFQDPDFLSALKKATYEDLTVETSGDEELLVFSCAIEGSDDEGNTYESGLYLYFSQGDPSLLLENFLAAG